MGCFTMPKGIPNKRYTPEFKKQVVEAVIQDGLSYQEAARIYEVHMTVWPHGNGSIWKKARKALQLNAAGGRAQAGRRSCPAK